MTPTQRSLQHLKALGDAGHFVQHWEQQTKIGRDLFELDVLVLE